MRVVIFGGRDFHNQRLAFKALDKLHVEHEFTVVISGMANGADMLAWEWAKARNIPCDEYPAEWNKYGRSAGPIRNKQMIVEGKPDLGVAFPGGTGTENMKKQLKAAGIPIRLVVPVGMIGK